MNASIYIGCAGWTIPSASAHLFPTTGTHLERYAARLPATEINTSFKKRHRPATYSAWAATVPNDFRFAVKMSRQITHASRLADLSALGYFIADLQHLGEKLGPILVQLPPSLVFSPTLAREFLRSLRERFDGGVVCEPRHASWFSTEAERLLVEFRVARVAADPPPVAGAGQPGGWSGLVYYRLHGSPRVYYSSYADAYLHDLASALLSVAASAQVWCIFDNTAAGAAVANALALLAHLKERSG